ncbi:MAG: DUF3606 domain-containing protein [Burkholderiales bacterium]
MLVDKDVRTPEDTTRINLESDWEIHYWCARYSVGEDELRACVLQVGTQADDLERHLEKARKQVFQHTGED